MDSAVENSSSASWFNLCDRLETEEINPQLSSPLYNGRIPAEIRTLIFEFAVTEFPSPKAQIIKTDTCVQQSHDLLPLPEVSNSSMAENTVEQVRDQLHGVGRQSRRMRPFTMSHTRQPQDGFDWLRFDNTEPMRVSTTLLLTCRRAYLECHLLPLLQTEQRFYCHRGPFSGEVEGSRSDIRSFVMNWLSNPAPVSSLKQSDVVRSVRLFTQQFWLEDTFESFVCTDYWFPNLEHLRITLRRSDWWNWEQNATLKINPFRRGNCQHNQIVDVMRRDIASTDDGSIEFEPRSWGTAFSRMPTLKTLTIDFETSEDKRDQMEAIVDWALKWKFPLAYGRHLSTCGQPATKTSWRGLPHHWSDRCVSCGIHARLSLSGPECLKCKETRQLAERRHGPQLFIWTCFGMFSILNWVAVYSKSAYLSRGLSVTKSGEVPIKPTSESTGASKPSRLWASVP
ncbi:hypothetical protein F4777DRAFT_560223 [Nemania sp. FL0916]|nr:hypothetical protein F4777DRAFT_560223 [Nemania sp. FL0916]